MKLLIMLSYLLDLVRSFDPVPDIPSDQDYNDRSTGFKKVVDDWINPATRSSIETTYGPIANWDTSGVTNMNHLFQSKTTFNENISEWDVSNVETMLSSTFLVLLFSFQRDRLSTKSFPFFFFLFSSKMSTIRLAHPLTFLLSSPLSLSNYFLTLQRLKMLKHSTRTSRNGRCPK